MVQSNLKHHVAAAHNLMAFATESCTTVFPITPAHNVYQQVAGDLEIGELRFAPADIRDLLGWNIVRIEDLLGFRPIDAASAYFDSDDDIASILLDKGDRRLEIEFRIRSGVESYRVNRITATSVKRTPWALIPAHFHTAIEWLIAG